MNIGVVKKELVCSVKDKSMDAAKIFLVHILDLSGKETGKYVVAVDKKLGIGSGDIVLIVGEALPGKSWDMIICPLMPASLPK